MSGHIDRKCFIGEKCGILPLVLPFRTMPRKPSPQPARRFPVEEEIYIVISHAHHLMRRLAERQLSGTGVTLVEYNLLRIIESAPNVTATEIRTLLDASAPSITHIITSIEKKGLIKRSMDRSDARRQHMTLTPKGKEMLQKGKKAISKTTKELAFSEKWYLETVDRIIDFNTRLKKNRHVGDSLSA